MVYTALFLENLYTFVKICTPFMALTDSEIKLSILSKSLHINKNRGLTLSGTKTHVKQRFLPLTPLLMVSDVLWSPVLPA